MTPVVYAMQQCSAFQRITIYILEQYNELKSISKYVAYFLPNDILTWTNWLTYRSKLLVVYGLWVQLTTWPIVFVPVLSAGR